MSWLDVLKIGAAALDVGATVKQVDTTIKSEKEFKQRYPEAYAVHQELYLACLDSKFDFKLHPGAPAYVSTMLMRGLLSSQSMKCTTLVNPEAKLIEAVYEPEEGIFVISDERMPRLLNWVNSRLHVGRFYVVAHSPNLHRQDLIQLGYRVAVPYAGVDKSQIKRLAGNLFAELIAFHDLYVPVIRAVGEQKLSFDRRGQLEGPATAQANDEHTRARQQLAKAAQPAGAAQLLPNLQQQLDANNIGWEPVAGQPMVRVKLPPKLSTEATCSAYVTTLDQVVLEARARGAIPSDCCAAVAGSKYLQFLNWGWTFSGAYFLDFTDNRMVCRAGINAAKFERQPLPALFPQVAASFIQMVRRLGDLCLVAEAPVQEPGRNYATWRSLSYEGIVAAVSMAMEQAQDPLWSDYRTMVSHFNSDVGAVLEEINA